MHFRLHIPLSKPDVRVYRIRLSDKPPFLFTSLAAERRGKGGGGAQSNNPVELPVTLLVVES
jgi:hypothetical protein